MNECLEYVMFGSCPRPKCSHPHEIEHVQKQEFFVAQIISEMPKEGNFVSLRWNQNSLKTQFFTGNGHWSRNSAKQWDLVVFQTFTEKCVLQNSSQRRFDIGEGQWNRNGTATGDLVVYQTSKSDNAIYPRGRVFSVLYEDWSEDWSVPCINFAVKESAFTLDPIEARYYNDAITIEDCKENEHSDCKQIGIHIVVAATPQKVSVDDVSSNFRRNINSLEKGKYRLTVSVYLHTDENGFVTEPEFSVIRVTDNYKIFRDKEEYLPYRKILWSHFQRLKNTKIAKTGACRYLSSTPKIWKEFFILGELMAAFNAGVRKLPKFEAHFITAVIREDQEKISEKILVPEEFFENALKCFVDEDGESDLDVLPLVAAGRMSQWKDLPAHPLPLKYERDVEIYSNLEEERVIKCTSPMRKIQDYLNQQILIRCMINVKSELYKETELLGILGIRFRTPQKLLAVIKSIDKTSFTVYYNGCQSINSAICVIDYATLCDKHTKVKEILTIYLEKIFCEEKHYCNRSIVSCDGKLFNNFIEEFCKKQRDLKKIQQHFRDMKKSKERQVSTYTNADDGTIISLQPRSELQLQISNYDAGNKRGLGLRLLRIGRNCHLCLLHKNHPELAFMSDRKDIREQNLESRIEIVTKMTTETIQLKNVNIEWCDEYFSGGTFLATCNILPGDFLCIRKEISSGENREGVAMYVWNAHGIVVTYIEEKVKFSVCTLSQTEKPESETTKSDEKGFCVDIISTKQLN